MKKVRRDWLRRQVEAGKMEAKSLFYFDAMTDSCEMGNGGWLPARIRTEYKDWIEGWYNLWDSYFTDKHISASLGENGIYTLHVHSNHVDLLRFKGETK